MRTIDLILLLNDFKKDNRIFIEDNGQRLAVVDIEIIDNTVILKTSKNLHGLRNWEFLVLLNKKDYYEFPIFYHNKNSHKQLFGFRVANDCLLLG
ncbi:hypothetical protein CPEBRM1_ABPJDJAI_00609 [Companilactobacillus paralimentarius]|uniref:hypothetical protein n=1 Tax=Companilactobacillus paralimentarius TaxID=83526 RepID=UPI00384BBC79